MRVSLSSGGGSDEGLSLLRSLQVEVVVSLLPPVARSGPHRVVLVLSSLVPVHWGVLAPGLHGDVSVYVRTACCCFDVGSGDSVGCLSVIHYLSS